MPGRTGIGKEEKPTMPDTKKAVIPDLSNVELRRRGQHDAGSWWSNRGRVQFTGLGTRRIGKLGLQLGLTQRPAKLLVVPDPEKQNLYVIPVQEHPLAVDAHYAESKCEVNLAPLFAYLGHITMAGAREFHPVEFSPEPVDVDGTAFQALIMPLKATEIRWKKNAKSSEPAAEQARQESAPAKE